MKVVELVKLGGEMLKTMSENGVMLNDWKYVSMYEAYRNMRANRMKHTAAVGELSEEYKVSERTVERVIKRLSLNVNTINEQ